MTELTNHYSASAPKKGVLGYAMRAPGYVPLLWKSRVLVWNFFRRELLGRFRGSFLGVFWVLLQPAFQFLIYFSVFGILFARSSTLSQVDFAIYLFAGIVFFTSVVEGTSTAMRSILANGNLVKKVAFPCEVLPLTPALIAAVVYLVGSVVLLLAGLGASFFIAADSSPPLQVGLSILALPILLCLQVMFVVGLGMFLAATNVFARDTSYLYSIFTQAWFFLSPNFWTTDLIYGTAERYGISESTANILMLLNPMFPFLMAQRQIFGVGTGLSSEMYASYFPTSLGENLLMALAWASLSMVLGYGFFMSRKRKFADLV
ncbi:MAG: ABC transporter permease [Planctomycetota bacterium]